MQKVEICGVDTSGLPKLTAKENEELMKRLKNGDKQARDKFIIGNMRLVLSLVKRFRIKNLGADDVFQAGCVGLIKAIDGFDLSVGVKFSTYAVPMIIGEIKRYLRDGNSLRVSRSIRDMAYKVLKAREEIESHDEEATIEKIAEVLQVNARWCMHSTRSPTPFPFTSPCIIKQAIPCYSWTSSATKRTRTRSGRNTSHFRRQWKSWASGKRKFCSCVTTRAKRKRKFPKK